MKLSKAQQKVIDEAKRQINKALENDFVEWCGSNYKHIDEYVGYRERLERTYSESRNGIVELHCNSRTLYALEKFGLIEIIHDSKNDGGEIQFDKIRLLNY